MRILKRILVLLVFVCSIFMLVGCREKDNNGNKNVKIGILQLVSHGALDQAREGFIEGLKQAGYKDGDNCEIIVKNPEADTPTLNQMSTELVRTCDIVLAIATPAATAVQAACEATGSNIPVLFTAVTDAVEAKLVASNEKPGGNITGTSDMNPVAAQVDLIKELIPGVKKFGVLYNVSEVNSQVQASLAKEEAAKHGIEVIELTVSDAQALASTTRQMINQGAEAIYLPTDNLIAKNMPAVTQVTNELGIPTICGEESMVNAGGTMTYGINYFALGIQTSVQAVKILKGSKPADIAVETQPDEDLSITINDEVVEALGIVVPASILERAGKLNIKEGAKIGILQLVTHNALDDARIGFITQLKKAGYTDGVNCTITVKNPEADTPTLNQMAQELVRSCDLVLAIATPAAIALQAACDALEKDIPILFTAVTDPVAAKLVDSNEAPGHNITGTNDMNPVEAQIDLMKEVKPTIKKFGILYNVNEVNSKVQADLAVAEAEKQGLEAIVLTVSDATAISTTTRQLINQGAEAIYLPTDNLVSQNMPAIVSVCEELKVFTVCGEEGQVQNGGCVTYGISYNALGAQTGKMAVKILAGANPATMPVESLDADKLTIAINEEAFATIDLTVPESLKK